MAAQSLFSTASSFSFSRVEGVRPLLYTQLLPQMKHVSVHMQVISLQSLIPPRSEWCSPVQGGPLEGNFFRDLLLPWSCYGLQVFAHRLGFWG